MKQFGEQLKKLREEKRLSQEQLGYIFNVSQSSISSYESGDKEPDQTTLIKMATFFNVTNDYLLGASKSWKAKEESAPYMVDKESIELALRIQKLPAKDRHAFETLLNMAERKGSEHNEAAAGE